MTVEAVMSLGQTYNEAVARLIVRETRRRNGMESPKIASMSSKTLAKLSQKCFHRGRPGRIVCKCRKKMQIMKGKITKTRKDVFVVEILDTLRKACLNRSDRNGDKEEQRDRAMVLVTPTAFSVTTRIQRSLWWMLYSSCRKHMSNNK